LLGRADPPPGGVGGVTNRSRSLIDVPQDRVAIDHAQRASYRAAVLRSQHVSTSVRQTVQFDEFKHDLPHEQSSSPELEERIAMLRQLIANCQPLDRALFSTMGAAIMVQTLVSVAVAVALWRQRFADRTLGWALRLGMTMTIAGALTGPLMTRPTAEQLADARARGHITTVGTHTVGAPDGGPGLPVTGWSREHGDVRVPHFIGLHAIQALALVAVGLRRLRRPDTVRVRVVLAAAASYVSLFLLLLWQALRGQSVIAPDAMALASITIWAVITMLAVGWIALGARAASPDGLDRMTA